MLAFAPVDDVQEDPTVHRHQDQLLGGRRRADAERRGLRRRSPTSTPSPTGTSRAASPPRALRVRRRYRHGLGDAGADHQPPAARGDQRARLLGRQDRRDRHLAGRRRHPRRLGRRRRLRQADRRQPGRHPDLGRRSPASTRPRSTPAPSASSSAGSAPPIAPSTCGSPSCGSPPTRSSNLKDRHAAHRQARRAGNAGRRRGLLRRRSQDLPDRPHRGPAGGPRHARAGATATAGTSPGSASCRCRPSRSTPPSAIRRSWSRGWSRRSSTSRKR